MKVNFVDAKISNLSKNLFAISTHFSFFALRQHRFAVDTSFTLSSLTIHRLIRMIFFQK